MFAPFNLELPPTDYVAWFGMKLAHIVITHSEGQMRAYDVLQMKDEFLSRCAASITACWHLMTGREFTEVERALSNYLPLLATWAKQPFSQQKVSADFAASKQLNMREYQSIAICI